MPPFGRRSLLLTGLTFAVPPGILPWLSGCQQSEDGQATEQQSVSQSPSLTNTSQPPVEKVKAMKLHYLEIVTPDVEGICALYSRVHGLTFAEPIASLGGARTATLDGASLMGVRGPLRDNETPVVRPYLLVDDIVASVKAAEAAGAKVALPPMEIPGHGQCAIVLMGGIECGLWQI